MASYVFETYLSIKWNSDEHFAVANQLRSELHLISLKILQKGHGSFEYKNREIKDLGESDE